MRGTNGWEKGEGPQEPVGVGRGSHRRSPSQKQGEGVKKVGRAWGQAGAWARGAAMVACVGVVPMGMDAADGWGKLGG